MLSATVARLQQEGESFKGAGAVNCMQSFVRSPGAADTRSLVTEVIQGLEAHPKSRCYRAATGQYSCRGREVKKMKKLTLIVVALAFVAGSALTAFGTPTIAKNTGKNCKECHGTYDNGSGGGGPHEKGPGGNRNK